MLSAHEANQYGMQKRREGDFVEAYKFFDYAVKNAETPNAAYFYNRCFALLAAARTDALVNLSGPIFDDFMAFMLLNIRDSEVNRRQDLSPELTAQTRQAQYQQYLAKINSLYLMMTNTYQDRDEMLNLVRISLLAQVYANQFKQIELPDRYYQVDPLKKFINELILNPQMRENEYFRDLNPENKAVISEPRNLIYLSHFYFYGIMPLYLK